MGSCILNQTRSQFCGGRKPECPEETLKVRLRSTETRSTYNIPAEVEGVIDVHYTSLTSQGVQHRVFYVDGHPSRYQPRPTGLNFGEQTGTGVFPTWSLGFGHPSRYQPRPTGLNFGEQTETGVFPLVIAAHSQMSFLM